MLVSGLIMFLNFKITHDLVIALCFTVFCLAEHDGMHRIWIKIHLTESVSLCRSAFIGTSPLRDYTMIDLESM